MIYKFNDMGMLIYKGVVLDISAINIFNMIKQNINIKSIVEEEYNIIKSIIRQNTLNKLLLDK